MARKVEICIRLVARVAAGYKSLAIDISVVVEGCDVFQLKKAGVGVIGYAVKLVAVSNAVH